MGVSRFTGHRERQASGAYIGVASRPPQRMAARRALRGTLADTGCFQQPVEAAPSGGAEVPGIADAGSKSRQTLSAAAARAIGM